MVKHLRIRPAAGGETLFPSAKEMKSEWRMPFEQLQIALREQGRRICDAADKEQVRASGENLVKRFRFVRQVWHLMHHTRREPERTIGEAIAGLSAGGLREKR